MLLSAPEAAHTDLSKLEMLIGGSALPRGLAEAALRAVSTSIPDMACRKPARC